MSVYVGDDGCSFHTPGKEVLLGDIETSTGVLASLGLVRRYIIPDINAGNGNAIFLDMVTLTRFGADFFKACEGICFTQEPKRQERSNTKTRERKPRTAKRASKN